MEDFIREVEEGDATAENVPDIYDKLEVLTRFQLTDEEKSVRDVLAAFGAPIDSVGIVDDGHITATIPVSPRFPLDTTRFYDNNTLFQAASISKAIKNSGYNEALPKRQSRSRYAYLTIFKSRTNILEPNPKNSALGLTNFTLPSVVPHVRPPCFWFRWLL
jgi:hypothetical protein